MKFAKTFCRANSVISVIPAGLPVKLQYNEHGLLQTFRIGFTNNLDPMYECPDLKFNHEELFARIKKFVPNMISTRGGTTWVFGIFYSDNVPMDEGEMPRALFQSYVNDLLKGGQYSFYAGYANSRAAQFSGSLMVRNFLTMQKFDLLPQVVVPTSMQDETLKMLMSDANYPFNKPFISGYIIFEDLNCRYVSDTLFQIKVSNEPKLEVGEDGFWKAVVTSESGDSYTFSYSSILHNSIKKNTVILAEKENAAGALKIVTTRLKGGMQVVPKTTSESIKCPVCGKVNMIGTDNAPVQCDDPHCLSHQYADAKKMLKVLSLPELSYEAYAENVRAKNILCLTDILVLPEYKDTEVTVSLAQAINAVVPATAVPNSEIFERFANKCNNSVESVLYYLDNPLRIETDLDLVDPIVKKFAAWLEDPYNASTVRTILDAVRIEARKQKFEGDPIFRGMTFVTTGKFKRGDYQEIASILESYAAKVTPGFEQGSKLPNAVIQGSLNDGVSGQVIQKARLHNVPILDEDAFFEQYEIDDDLKRNLL